MPTLVIHAYDGPQDGSDITNKIYKHMFRMLAVHCSIAFNRG